MVQRWEAYYKEGAEGLERKTRQACSASGTGKERPPKLDKKVEEDLIAENQRLRMEIEYLKTECLSLQDERKNGKRRK
ncbi:MAG: hypothetical protein ACLS48_09210 [[Eubacterium] siraeum]